MMEPRMTVWIFTVLLTCLAAAWDWQSRRIPNWLTVSGAIVGITLHSVLEGWHGALFALGGIGLALALLMPLVYLRALGAGDWKLMGAVGAFVGWQLFLVILLGSILVAGMMAVAQMVRAQRVTDTLRNLWTLLKGFAAFGMVKNPKINLDNPGLLKLPFGVAVAVTTIVYFCAAYWPAWKHIL
jgi:prepilin peptidase CpaA